MYYIINKTTRTTLTHVGGWPGNYLDQRLKDGEDIIVISTYSNTIKVPFQVNQDEYDWTDYPLPSLSHELVS